MGNDNLKETVLQEEKINSEEIEKNSYSKYMYKKLKRAKKKGIQHGISIPDLKYQLDKPQHPRIVFKIIGYIMLVLSILTVVGIVALYGFSGIFSVFGDVFKQSATAFTYETLQKTLGLSSIAAIGIFGLYALLAVLIIFPILIAWVLIKFTIKNFSLSTISRQEMAEGFEIRNYIIGLFTAMTIAVAVIVAIIYEKIITAPFGIVALSVSAVIFVISLLLAIFLLKERKQEKEWFKTLAEEKQADFKAQNDAVLHLKRELERQKTDANVLGGRW